MKGQTAGRAEDAERTRLNGIGESIVGSAIEVHSALGPGLLESAYEACLLHELLKRDLIVQRQVPMAVRYDSVDLDVGYRLDLLIAGSVVVEIKAVESLLPVHMAQTLSYLKLGRFKLGYLLNFHVSLMRDGTKRIVNGL